MNKKILDHHLQFSLFTDPGLYKDILKSELPNDIKKIGLLVRKQIIHRVTLKNGNTGTNTDLRYGDITHVPWFRQCEDDNLPTAASMIIELYRRDKRGFIENRNAENKLILTCRSVSILMASILKSKGIPTRVRSGFAQYFNAVGLPKNTSCDHWINQYWDFKKSRWITIDVDGSFEDYITFDPYDLPIEVFDFPGDVWLRIRNGKLDEKHFYNAGGFFGLLPVVWELFYDFHCLMNSEIIYQHAPSIVGLKNFPKLNETQLKEIDQLAYLMQSPDDNFDKLQRIWETKKEFRILMGGLL